MKTFEEFINSYYVKNASTINEEDTYNYNQNEKNVDNEVNIDASKETNEKTDLSTTDKTQEGGKYFFKNILFFTNDRDPKSNKTLKNLNAAIKGTDINIYTFVAEEVDYKATDNKIKISDKEIDFKSLQT